MLRGPSAQDFAQWEQKIATPRRRQEMAGGGLFAESSNLGSEMASTKGS